MSWKWHTPFSGVKDPFPLHHSAPCELYDLVKHLIAKYPEHINAMGGRMVAPLVAALYGKTFPDGGITRL